MRAKCKCCDKYRQCRGSSVCDECAEEMFYANGGYEWLRDARKGYGAVMGEHDVSSRDNMIIMLCERRWKPARKTDTPSIIWDPATPSVGYA